MAATPSLEDQQTAPKIYEYRTRYDQVTPLEPHQATIAKAFVHTAQQMGDRVAMRKKRYGIWQEYTWRDSLDHVRSFCLGLVSLGLQRGDKIAIIGENDPESYWAEYAAHCAGAISIAIFTDANLQELEFIVNNGDATFLIAHDQEQCDKALSLREKIPNIRKVIYWEGSGLWNYQEDWLIPFAEVEALGRQYAQKHPNAFEELVKQGQSDDIAIFSYTSGTSGLPKGAMVSHANLLYATKHTEETIPVLPDDEYVSFSPLAWITEQGLGLASHARKGFTVSFPEGPETVQTDLREIAPHALLFPSRIWENLSRSMQMRVNDSTWINRVLYRVFLPVAYQVIDLEDEHKPIPPHLKVLRGLADLAVLQPLRDKIGMTRVRNAFTSGAVLSPDVLRFFRAVGVTLKSIYGATEMQGVAMHHEGNVKLASVGAPAPGVQVKIAKDGEIRVRSRGVFKGYYKMADKTAESFDEDGFFRTGDAGYVDEDGHLIYLDRVKDMIELANGERFSPQYIEGRLKFSPYVQDVMTVGGFDMEYVTAIVIIDFENVSRWAEKNRVNFTTYVDLTQKSEVYQLIQQEVERVNATLPPSARIRKFVILHKAFDADEAELTRTRKLRRHALEQRYGEMLDAMYNNRASVRVSAEVKYRDGRTGVVETDVRVATVIP
ncbi:MAG: AMP-binding protein [Anaerolineae bacterium]|jgi:long-chain acyl-CoA synthetase|nr:AMP-binding protein [Anaerolineae bacterium]